MPLDNPGQRFDSDALLGISAPARRERAACPARNLAPILEDIRAGGITSLNRPNWYATYRGSRAWSAVQVHGLIAPAGREPSSEKQIAGMKGSAAAQVNLSPLSGALASYSSQ